MSDFKKLSERLTAFAGTMSPYIVKKAFTDMAINGENIPPTMKLRVVDTILERIVFDRQLHYELRLELLQTLEC
ncbi:MAG: hypothetical protein KKH41_09735 [Candidatus Thermoplasmatota archaeon]|nr:hypothetical protein [Euryarchaeota archaeon]MBU4031724.1 hypothetical protein [Candidatus Thermoplasmatota archaeon]MBU4070750.1 hypothetical protein [Candidatus Thermoplasmatota archaeon]MBU4144741.1 hypothetical protein [Candidatus Thermoplasmatota archaeon]MBU4592843.1 hypothetical protein [Candidatus Thermoplasmatota archaeon]